VTIQMKLDQVFTGTDMPVVPHGHGVQLAESPFRWVADKLPGTVGDVVSSWPEQTGVAVLTGTSGAAKLASVGGFRAVSFDGTGALAIASTAPMSSRGSLCGVARLAPEAAVASQYGLASFYNPTSSPGATDGRLLRATDGKMLFDRLSTAAGNVKAAASVMPGNYFTFGISNATGMARGMLNGVNFDIAAGDITGFQRLFLGTTGSGVNWLGSVFEIGAWNSLLTPTHFTQFHNAMKEHYSFLA
jgi:hypothetical protein